MSNNDKDSGIRDHYGLRAERQIIRAKHMQTRRQPMPMNVNQETDTIGCFYIFYTMSQASAYRFDFHNQTGPKWPQAELSQNNKHVEIGRLKNRPRPLKRWPRQRYEKLANFKLTESGRGLRDQTKLPSHCLNPTNVWEGPHSLRSKLQTSRLQTGAVSGNERRFTTHRKHVTVRDILYIN